MYNKNVAYDFSLFEEKKRKKEEKEEKKEEKEKVISEEQNLKKYRVRYNPLSIIAFICLGCVIIFTVVTIITGQVELTELSSEVNDAQDILDEKKSIYTQLNMQLEAKIPLAYVEEYAKNNLHMDKTKGSQIQYVPLAENDVAECEQEDSKSWLEVIEDFVHMLVSSGE